MESMPLVAISGNEYQLLSAAMLFIRCSHKEHGEEVKGGREGRLDGLCCRREGEKGQ